MYLLWLKPAGVDTLGGSNDKSGPSQRQGSVGPKMRKPNDPGSENHEAREQAESKAATNGPVVNPDTLQAADRGELPGEMRVPKQKTQNAPSEPR